MNELIARMSVTRVTFDCGAQDTQLYTFSRLELNYARVPAYIPLSGQQFPLLCSKSVDLKRRRACIQTGSHSHKIHVVLSTGHHEWSLFIK